MSIGTCIADILKYKDFLIKNYSTHITSSNRAANFLRLLTSPITLSSFPTLSYRKKEATYLNSYFHACLLAVYLEQEGYSLEIWNEYVSSIYPNLKIHSSYSPHTLVFNEDKIFELFILHTVNNTFKLNNIIALRANVDSAPTKLFDDYLDEKLSSSTTKKILEKVQVTMKIRGEPEIKVWGDNDILIVAYPSSLEQAEVISIISCKTSLRERVYQSIFWATHSRIEGVAKHTFATLDKGNKGKSEIGNRISGSNSRKTRNVLESTMDRVYVFRKFNEVSRSYVIKDFSYLKDDLEKWRIDYFGL